MSFLGEDALTLGELAEFTVDKAKEQRGSDKNSSTDTLVPEVDGASPKDAEKFIIESLQTVLGMTASDMESLGELSRSLFTSLPRSRFVAWSSHKRFVNARVIARYRLYLVYAAARRCAQEIRGRPSDDIPWRRCAHAIRARRVHSREGAGVKEA